jgi:hypothetical protein
MKSIKRITTTLQLLIQSVRKSIDRFMVCFFPESRTCLVHTVNRCTWLSNILRRCTGKPLFSGKNKAPTLRLLSSFCADIKLILKKTVLHIGKFVLSHQKTKKTCKHILCYFPPLQSKLKQLFYTAPHSFLDSSSILNTVGLSPKSEAIYKLLSK